MAHITGHDRSQTLLLPEAVDDYVSADNPVRFIDAFVDGLDLAAAGFSRVVPKVTGRPGYAPADLLKLYIYGYLIKVLAGGHTLAALGHHYLLKDGVLRRVLPLPAQAATEAQAPPPARPPPPSHGRPATASIPLFPPAFAPSGIIP